MYMYMTLPYMDYYKKANGTMIVYFVCMLEWEQQGLLYSGTSE